MKTTIGNPENKRPEPVRPVPTGRSPCRWVLSQTGTDDSIGRKCEKLGMILAKNMASVNDQEAGKKIL